MSKNVTSEHPSTTVIIDNDVEDSDSDDDEYFMRKSLEVAQRALEIGEVPVGCVIVLDKDHPAVLSKKKYNHLDNINTDNGTNSIPRERRGVIISHGANQVNATRDATRHAEIVAIDRLLTDGVSSDQLRLPQAFDRKSNNNAEKNNDSSVGCKKRRHSTVTCGQNEFEDRLLNVPSHPGHWANLFGWGNNFVLQSKKSDDGNMDEDLKVISSSLRSKDIFRHCQLYVTCEPCIMCAAALAMVGIRRVVFGCKNQRFGGNGSILHLHEAEGSDETCQPAACYNADKHSAMNPGTFTTKSMGYKIKHGVLEKEAIRMLRTFYDRENFHAPDCKRKRKHT